MNTGTLIFAFVFASVMVCYGQAPFRANTPAFGAHAYRPAPSLPEDGDTSEGGFRIEGLTFETGAALIEDWFAAGMGVEFKLNYPFRLGARMSVDIRDFNPYVVPFFGLGWDGIGGFWLGRMIKPDEPPIPIPHYYAWRVWGGREDVFTISLDVLTNVPAMGVGYYDAGVKFNLNQKPDRLYIGVANYGLKDEISIIGPAVKSEWRLDDGSWLLVNASYIFNHDKHNYIPKYTIGIGWKVQAQFGDE